MSVFVVLFLNEIGLFTAVVGWELHTLTLVTTALALLKRSQSDFTKTRLVYGVVALLQLYG